MNGPSLAARVLACDTAKAGLDGPCAGKSPNCFRETRPEEMSKAHRELGQLSIGHGWPELLSNQQRRMMFSDQDGMGYQNRTRDAH